MRGESDKKQRKKGRHRGESIFGPIVADLEEGQSALLRLKARKEIGFRWWCLHSILTHDRCLRKEHSQPKNRSPRLLTYSEVGTQGRRQANRGLRSDKSKQGNEQMP